MNVTITGITDSDLLELESELQDHEAHFEEVENSQYGAGDMGIFSLGIPLTVAVTKVLTTWIKSRKPLTEVEVTTEAGTAKFKSSGKKMDPADLEKFVEILSGH